MSPWTYSLTRIHPLHPDRRQPCHRRPTLQHSCSASKSNFL